MAQPLLGLLGVNDAYIETENLNGLAVLISTGIVLLGIPLAMFLAVRAAAAVRREFGVRVLAAVLVGLASLPPLHLLKVVSVMPVVQNVGLPGVLLLLVSFGGGVLMTRAYFRRPAVRTFLTILSLCSLAIPLAFCMNPPVQRVLGMATPQDAQRGTRIGNPVPVVLIVCDGLNGMALLNENFELDSERYPGFGRLASLSTWYRNASTVHYRTDKAVPAILTGNRPLENRTPTEENHPENLFRRVVDSQQYEVTVFEPYTRLCPDNLKLVAERLPITRQVSSMLSTLARVFLVTTIPNGIVDMDGIIPKPWFGLPQQTRFKETTRTGLLNYAWDGDRALQLRHFQDCLTNSDKPGFRFLHIVAPHYPWIYLPDGRAYHNDAGAQNFPVGAHGIQHEDWGPDTLPCHHAWQRYLLQLGFLDACLNQIIEQLESEKILDDCLLIVVGDHGAAFVPGTNRRVPTSATLPDIMSVPLFIKLPNQTAPQISDRNVETIDILPTIVDVLKMSPDVEMDGSSLLDEQIRERPRKQMSGPDCDYIIAPDFENRFDYARRMTKLFGSGSSNKLWSVLQTIPQLVDRPLAELDVSETGGVAVDIPFGMDLTKATTKTFVPCLIHGRVRATNLQQPVELAVTVNGYVRVTTRTSTDPLINTQWSTMIRPDHFAAGQNDVRIYEVIRTPVGYSLKRCAVETNNIEDGGDI